MADRFDNASSKMDDLSSRISRIEQFWVEENEQPLEGREGADRFFDLQTNRQQLEDFYNSLINHARDLEVRNGEWMCRYRDMIKGWDPDIVHAPMLDIDCGCGVWLELLVRMGFNASGIEQEGTLVSASQSRGLPVIQAHVLNHLHSLESGAHGFISAFRLADLHSLPTTYLAATEIYRVLRMGGLAIFHLPNALPERWLNNATAPSIVDRRADPLQIMSFLLIHVGFNIHCVYVCPDRSPCQPRGPSVWPRGIAVRKPIGSAP